MKKDKARDIARGTLPSKARKGARDKKRNFHASHRHAQRQVNNDILRRTTVIGDDGLYTDPDLYDDFDGKVIYDGYHASTKNRNADDMSYIVDDRREADKLGPLLRWAEATERNKMVGWDDRDKFAYFKAILPDSLQGRHALGHVKSALDLVTDEFEYGRLSWGRRNTAVDEDGFRAALRRHLSTSKGRVALHEFLLEAVPVAGHSTPSNLKVKTREQARDENGGLVYKNEIVTVYDAPTKRFVTAQRRTPVYAETLIPKMIPATCDDCSFLRNDPLATTESINRFVEIVYYNQLRAPRNRDIKHSFRGEIIKYITT